jgi:hypothetical protein
MGLLLELDWLAGAENLAAGLCLYYIEKILDDAECGEDGLESNGA